MKELWKRFRQTNDFGDFVRENKDMLIKVAGAGMLVIAAFFVFLSHGAESQEIMVEEQPVKTEEEMSAAIYVDIGGEVVNPMVVKLEEGSRVEDAIEAAGGVTEEADLTQINRAAFLEDGEKIFIPAMVTPSEEETAALGAADGAVQTQIYSDGRININTADAEELQQLTGVGPATAEKIIDYREEYGWFSTVEDIQNVSGIGEKTFEKLKDDIKV